MRNVAQITVLEFYNLNDGLMAEMGFNVGMLSPLKTLESALKRAFQCEITWKQVDEVGLEAVFWSCSECWVRSA